MHRKNGCTWLEMWCKFSRCLFEHWTREFSVLERKENECNYYFVSVIMKKNYNRALMVNPCCERFFFRRSSVWFLLYLLFYKTFSWNRNISKKRWFNVLWLIPILILKNDFLSCFTIKLFSLNDSIAHLIWSTIFRLFCRCGPELIFDNNISVNRILTKGFSSFFIFSSFSISNYRRRNAEMSSEKSTALRFEWQEEGWSWLHTFAWWWKKWLDWS